jgi:uncharacterized protein (TIGR00369 family)
VNLKLAQKETTELVRSEFEKQEVMRSLGASLGKASPGSVEIELPFKESLTQQHGYIHAGIVTTIADSACGYAAWSLSPSGSEVLTVEYKVNFLSPAKGRKLVARGSVIRQGRTLTVCAADVFAVANHKERLVATMLATIMVIRKQGVKVAP